MKRPAIRLPVDWERHLLCSGEVVLTRPGYPPRIVRLDGKIEELKPQ